MGIVCTTIATYNKAYFDPLPILQYPDLEEWSNTLSASLEDPPAWLKLLHPVPHVQ